MNSRIFAVLVFPLVCSGALARADVITFEGVGGTGGGLSPVASGYQESGFSLTTSGPGFVAANAGHPNHFSGSFALSSLGARSVTEMTRSDGGLFDLLSIDLSEWHAGALGSGATSVSFVGYRADAEPVSHALVLDGAFGFETFQFDQRFAGLNSVSWTQHPSQFFQFDNIQVGASSVWAGPVLANPEPSSLALLGVGAASLLGYGWRGRRRPVQA